MVEALVRGLEGGRDNGSYILGMCSDLLLVASHSDPNFFLSHLGHLKVWYYLSSLSMQTEVFGETLQITLMFTKCNSIITFNSFLYFTFYFLFKNPKFKNILFKFRCGM